MRFDLLKNTAYITVITCSLGLVGCTSYQDDDYDVYATPKPACVDNNGMECVVLSDSQTALYLPERSEQTYTVTTTEVVPAQKTTKQTYYGSQTGTDLSVSAPAKQEGSPVRIKPTEPTIAVTIKPVMPAVTETPKVEVSSEPEPTEPVKTLQPIEPKPAEPTEPVTQEQPAEPAQETIVQPKTVQLQTVETKTIEIEEETQTTITTKDTSLLSKTAYGEKCHDWEAKAGDTLRGLLMQWADKSGWTVIWKLDRDYHLEAGVIFRGTFTEVSGALIRSFARATPAPIGTFYKGNRVLVISTQEDENAN